MFKIHFGNVAPGCTSSARLPIGYNGFFLRFGGKGYTLRRVRNIRLIANGRQILCFDDAAPRLDAWASCSSA